MRWYKALLLAWSLPVLVIWWLSNQETAIIRGQVVDLAAQAGLPGTTAAVSYVGIMLWHSAAAVCWFAATMLSGGAASGLRRAALLSLLLGVDDALMLHEEVLPGLLELPPTVVQPGLYCLYGAILLAALQQFPSLWRRSEAAIFVISLLCLGSSVLVDMLKDSELFDPRSKFILDEGYAMWIEESLKLLGIAAWALFWFRWCAWISRSGSLSNPVSQAPESQLH